MRNRLTVSEAVAMAATASSRQFQVDDPRLDLSGMRTYSSWADKCDQNNTPPTHGAKWVF